MATVDLNADLAEGEELTTSDRGVISAVTSVSIACGFHAGSPRAMRATARACVAQGVSIGAHVSYRDRVGFGRRALEVAPARLLSDLLEQCALLAREVDAAGGSVAYVKPHGALYHRMCADPLVAEVVLDAVLAQASPVLVAQAGSAVTALAGRAGVRVVLEGFPDRGYLPDGGLVPRSDGRALVGDPGTAAIRAVTMAGQGRVRSVDGGWATVPAETLCIHGDASDADVRARAVRSALESAGVTVEAFASSGSRARPGARG